jgi:hypothetical protein
MKKENQTKRKRVFLPVKGEPKLHATPEVKRSFVKKVTEPPMQRTLPPVKKSLRRELEGYVIGWNTVLREAVKSMDIITLLRNAHPAYRPTFAGACAEAGMISESSADEFRIGPAKSRAR